MLVNAYDQMVEGKKQSDLVAKYRYEGLDERLSRSLAFYISLRAQHISV